MSPPIYLLRHGETEWNAAGRIQGALDSPLTERGRQQARAVGRALARALSGALGGAIPPLHCSPRGRARQTLEIVCAETGLDAATCRFDDRLCEASWGIWDGMTRAEIEATAPGALAARRAAHWTHRPPGGSSYSDLALRLRPFLAEIAAEGGIVVGHGAVGRVLRGLHLGLPPERIVGLAEPQDVVFRLTAAGIEELREPG